MRYVPKSVEDDPVGFFEETRDDHNGLGLADLHEKVKAGVKNRRIAEDFGVDTTTFYRWRLALKKRGLWVEPEAPKKGG